MTLSTEVASARSGSAPDLSKAVTGTGSLDARGVAFVPAGTLATITRQFCTVVAPALSPWGLPSVE
jgi:hypothetical protein